MGPDQILRKKERIDFIKRAGWSDFQITALPVDASARCYFRLTNGDESRILMDAPPGVAEPVEVFAKVARHLFSCGISTPKVYFEDIEHGFLLLEDFGQNTYARLLSAGANEEELYELAVDVLVAMHSSEKLPAIDMPPYDLSFLIKETLIMADWYYPALAAKPLSLDARQSYVSSWCEVFNKLPSLPTTLVLRDFHIDNLMILDGREGVASCGLLDFQTAVLGVAPYDLMSLMEDARRDIGKEFRGRMIARYLSKMGKSYSSEKDRKAFLEWYSVLAAQRHAKVLGIFVRLCARDNKDAYLEHISRVVALMASAMEQDTLLPVRNWFEQNFSEFMSDLGSVDRELVTGLATKSEKSAVELL